MRVAVQICALCALVLAGIGDENGDSAMLSPGGGQGSASSEVSLGAVLGPLVINKDGTTARIKNWQTMTADEKARTLRIVGARNRKRIAQLKATEASDDGVDTDREL